jgi:hypothetical protein
MREKNSPKTLMRQVAENAFHLSLRNNNYRNPLGGKPGEYYQSLGPVQRAILRDLKPEDIADVRWPLYDNIDSSGRKK